MSENLEYNLKSEALLFQTSENVIADQDSKSPFVRKECSAVDGGHREEAPKEIAEAVANPQVERIDGQTAAIFLFVTFSFEVKEKVNAQGCKLLLQVLST